MRQILFCLVFLWQQFKKEENIIKCSFSSLQVTCVCQTNVSECFNYTGEIESHRGCHVASDPL